MSECINDKIASMVHAYELGLLDEEDSNAVEIHLLDCPHCNQRYLELVETTHKLRSDPEIQAVLKTLADETSEKDAPTRTTTETRNSRVTVIWSLGLAAAVIALVVLNPWNFSFEPDDPVWASGNTIAVMPFESLVTPDDTTRMSEIVINLLMTCPSQNISKSFPGGRSPMPVSI